MGKLSLAAIKILGALFLYCFSCLGWGLWIQRYLGINRNAPADRISAINEIASGFLLGLGFLSVVWLALGLSGLFDLGEVVPVLLIGISMSSLTIRWPSLTRELREHLKELRNESWPLQVLVGVVCVWALYGIVSIARPLSGDSMFFHMLIPKVMATSHRLSVSGLNPTMACLGLLGEMHYAGLMLVGRADSAQLLSWPTYLASAVMFGGCCRKLGLGTQGLWIALAAFFSSTAMIAWVGEGKIELFPCAMGIAAYFWMVIFLESQSARAALLAGLFVGWGIVGKLSYGLTLLPGILVMVAWSFFSASTYRKPFIFLLRSMVPISAGMFLAGLSTVIKNALLLGAPLAPFYPNSEKYFSWVKDPWYGPSTILHIKLTYPFAVTFGQYFAEYGNLSPIVLAFLPLSFFLSVPKPILRSKLIPLTLGAWVSIFLYTRSSPDKVVTRYFLASLIMCIPLAARAAENASLKLKSRTLDFVLLGACGLTLLSVISWSRALYFVGDAFAIFTGAARTCDSKPVWCAPMEAINSTAAYGERVFSTTEYLFYLRGDLIQCAGTPQWEEQNYNSQNFWGFLNQRGFRYLVVDRGTGSGKFLDSLLKNTPSGVEAQPLFESNLLASYRLRFTHSEARLTCAQKKRGEWAIEEL